MKTKLRFTIALLCSIVLILSSCHPKTNIPSGSAATPEERNKAVVLQYFKEILDGEQYILMPEVLTPGVTMHRPEGTLAFLGMVQGVFEKALSPHSMKTTIHEMVALRRLCVGAVEPRDDLLQRRSLHAKPAGAL